MTETTVTMCDALVPSPLEEGHQLACFLRPHHEDPWHYDNRGLGVWFRSVPGGVDARVGLVHHPDFNPEPEPANLPAPILGRLTFGGINLDVDDMRRMAPRVREQLVEAFRSAAAQFRAGRGTVVIPEDTYELVRRLTAAEEVMRQWQQAFDAAAKEAVALLEEEALTAIGALPGYEDAPAGSLFVPDGEGQRIAVTPDWKPGDSTWDVDTLKAWIAEQTVADEARKPDAEEVMPGEEPGDVPVWTNDEAVSLIRDGLDRLTNLGTFSPGIKKLDALRRQLSERGRDTDAGIIRQVRSVGLRQYRGVKVTREETK